MVAKGFGRELASGRPLARATQHRAAERRDATAAGAEGMAQTVVVLAAFRARLSTASPSSKPERREVVVERPMEWPGGTHVVSGLQVAAPRDAWMRAVGLAI